MKDGTLLRFDSIVAICALLASSIAAGAMVYQTRVIQEQYSATVWPYLALENDGDNDHTALYLVNEGVGPALLRSAQLYVDKRPVPDWNSAVRLLFKGVAQPRGARLAFSFRTLNASTAVRAGESTRIEWIHSTSPAVVAAVSAHHVALEICYCSINGRCWKVRSGDDYSGGGMPQNVNGCTSSATIGGHPFSRHPVRG